MQDSVAASFTQIPNRRLVRRESGLGRQPKMAQTAVCRSAHLICDTSDSIVRRVEEPNVTIAQQAPQPEFRSGGRSWWLGLLASFLFLGALTWILARVVFLPYYMGLFFYQVGGLLAASVAFRIARPERPIKRRRLLFGAVLVAIAAWCVSICFEYHDRIEGIARGPEFYEAKVKALAKGGSAADVMDRVRNELREHLRSTYAPGGVLGYVRWVVASGEYTLTADGVTDTVRIAHRRRAWVLRSIASICLMACGLYMGLESLSSPTPVSNLLVPGEEADDEDD